jgi:hypothetical protein
MHKLLIAVTDMNLSMYVALYRGEETAQTVTAEGEETVVALTATVIEVMNC